MIKVNNKKTYEKNKKVGIICTKPILLKKGNAKSKEHYKNNKERLQKTSINQLQKSSWRINRQKEKTWKKQT